MKLLRLLKRELANDAASWVEQRIITREQAAQILHHYGTELPSGERRTFGYYILLSIAALFMGLSLLVLVSANWEDIPRSARMLTLIALTVVLNGIGLHYFKVKKIHLSRIWFFIGSLAYGTTIFLIAQIYHIGEHFPDGILYWALGVLPVAFLTESILIMLLLAALSGIWLVLEARLGYLPAFYTLFTFSLFWFCLKHRRSLLIFLTSIAGTIFFCEVILIHLLRKDLFSVNFVFLNFGVEHVFFTVAAFILLLCLARYLMSFHPKPSAGQAKVSGSDIVDYGLLLHLWTIRFGLITMLIFSFDEPWNLLLKAAYKNPAFVLGCTIILPILAALFIVMTFKKANKPFSFFSKETLFENISPIAYTCFFCFCSLIILLLKGPGIYSAYTVFLQVMTNFALLMTGIWLIYQGFQTSSSSVFYIGVGLLLITALLRYFDLIGDYIGGAIVFFVAGCIMLVTARFWKRHLAGKEIY